MLKEHKKTLILSSALTLLPMAAGVLLEGRPSRAEGFGGLSAALYVMPLVMLAVQWLGVLLTVKLPGGREQSGKTLGIAFWIVPMLSIVSCAMVCLLALGLTDNPTWLIQLLLGALFLIIGNYLPKFRQNCTMGIKLPWTLADEENWNATHRMGGKVWAAAGAVTLLSMFLPSGIGSGVMAAALAGAILIPTVYSWRFARRKKAEGRPITTRIPKIAGNRKAAAGTLVFTAAILAGVAVLLFTGELQYRFDQDSFTVEASYYDDLTLPYDAIDELEYREGNVSGVRTFGFGSFRLLMGSFRNEELGNYTRYTYYRPESCIVLRCGGRTLVLSGSTAEETRAIYDELQSRS